MNPPKRLTSLLAPLCLAVALGTFLATSPAAFAQSPAASAAPTAAPAASDVVAPLPSAATSKETVDNPYGLAALWAQGDFVSRGTLIMLVIMSMGSWYILITKLYESLKISREAKMAQKTFFRSSNLSSAGNVPSRRS